MVVAKQVKAARVMLHVTTARTAAPDPLERGRFWSGVAVGKCRVPRFVPSRRY